MKKKFLKYVSSLVLPSILASISLYLISSFLGNYATSNEVDAKLKPVFEMMAKYDGLDERIKSMDAKIDILIMRGE